MASAARPKNFNLMAIRPHAPGPVSAGEDRDLRSAPEGVIALLQQLVDGQQRIIELLKRRDRSATPLSRADRALLARLLPAIGGAFGSELFLVRELFESDAAAVRWCCAA